MLKSKSKIKIAILSPFPLGENGYPHIDAIANGLSILGADVSVHHMPERGLCLAESASWRSLRQLKTVKSALLSCKYILTCSLKTAYRCLKIRREEYNAIICIDNFIYVHASTLCTGKIILWSLDFVGPDNLISNSSLQSLVKLLTYKALENKRHLIIQDRDREIDLFESLGLSADLRLNSFYLPVSLQCTADSSRFHRLCPAPIPILLQIGGINIKRSLSDQIIKNIALCNGKFELYLHGFFSHEIVHILRQSKYIPFISSIPLSPNQIPEVVRKCDIGLVFYGVKDLNFKNLASASNQLVEFLRCGKPVIAYGNASLCDKIEELGVGIGISDLSSIVDAASTIIKDYKSYSIKCVKAFEENYNASTYVRPLLTYLV